MADDLKSRAITAGRDPVSQSQADVASVRRQPISPQLETVLRTAANASGVTVDVTSGGQPGKGSKGPRTGSTRHDHGNAADIDLYRDGRKLAFTNKEDLPTFRKFVSEAVKAGATGVGAGTNYMGPSKLHVGFGREATWGGANWLSDAYAEGKAARSGATVARSGPTPAEASRDLPAGTLTRQIVTNYWPIQGGRDVGIEGSEKTSRPSPEGKYRVSTLEDYRTGKSGHVTIAADPSHYGEWYTIPSYTYVNNKGEKVTLENVPAYVHDTGSAFKGRPRKFDIAADYSSGDRHGAKLDRMNAGLNAGTVFVPSAGRPTIVAKQDGPKPGSSEYWASSKAKTQVASDLPDPGQVKKVEPQAPKPTQTAEAQPKSGDAPAKVPFFKPGDGGGAKPGSTEYWRGPQQQDPYPSYLTGERGEAGSGVASLPEIPETPTIPGAVVIRVRARRIA